MPRVLLNFTKAQMESVMDIAGAILHGSTLDLAQPDCIDNNEASLMTVDTYGTLR